MNRVLYLKDHPQTLSTYSSVLVLFNTGSSLSFIIDDNLIMTPHFSGGSILSTCFPFVQGGFTSLTYYSFPRRVHIFNLFLISEESPYIHHSFLQEILFWLHQDCRENIQTLLKLEAWSAHQQLSHRYSHTGALYLPYVPYTLYKSIIFLRSLIYHGTKYSVIFMQL